MCDNRDNLEFYAMDASNLKFSASSFDVICSLEVIEQVKNYKKYLSEVDRVLKPNGVYIVSTVNKALFSPNSEKPINKYHCQEFNLKEFQQLLKIYFAEVQLWGQNIKNKDFLTQFNKTQKVKNIIPGFIRRLLTNNIKPFFVRNFFGTEPKISLDDVIFTKDYLPHARYFIGVCRK